MRSYIPENCRPVPKIMISGICIRHGKIHVTFAKEEYMPTVFDFYSCIINYDPFSYSKSNPRDQVPMGISDHTVSKKSK